MATDRLLVRHMYALICTHVRHYDNTNIAAALHGAQARTGGAWVAPPVVSPQAVATVTSPTQGFGTSDGARARARGGLLAPARKAKLITHLSLPNRSTPLAYKGGEGSSSSRPHQRGLRALNCCQDPDASGSPIFWGRSAISLRYECADALGGNPR